MGPGLTANHTDGPLVGLAVEFQLLSVLLTLPIHFNSLGLLGTGVQTVQIIQLSDQVLHQVVLGVTLLVEHLGRHKVGLLFICDTAEFDIARMLIPSAAQWRQTVGKPDVNCGVKAIFRSTRRRRRCQQNQMRDGRRRRRFSAAQQGEKGVRARTAEQAAGPRRKCGRGQQTRYRSAVRTLVAVVIAILVPVQRDTEAAEAVAAFQDDRVFEIVQTNGTCELLPQLLTGGSAGRHFTHNRHAGRRFRHRK